MASDTGVCQACQSEISTAAVRCPRCGYEPAAEGSAGRTVLLLVGAVLTLTVVGAILGIPMMLMAFYSRRQAQQRRPTADAPQ